MASPVSFEGPLERLPDRGGLHIVTCPFDVEALFGTRGSVRVKGTMNDLTIDRALIPRGDGTHYIVLSPEMRRKAGLRLGNMVRFVLMRNEKPEELEFPEELSVALEMEPGALEILKQQTPGAVRGLVYWIDSAKRPETRAQRAAEMVRRLLNREAPFESRKK